jgi:hypothetical protein
MLDAQWARRNFGIKDDPSSFVVDRFEVPLMIRARTTNVGVHAGGYIGVGIGKVRFRANQPDDGIDDDGDGKADEDEVLTTPASFADASVNLIDYGARAGIRFLVPGRQVSLFLQFDYSYGLSNWVKPANGSEASFLNAVDVSVGMLF